MQTLQHAGMGNAVLCPHKVWPVTMSPGLCPYSRSGDGEQAGTFSLGFTLKLGGRGKEGKEKWPTVWFCQDGPPSQAGT